MANINYDLVLEVFQPLIRRFPALARSASHRVCNTKVSLETSTSSRPYGPSDQAVLATGYHGTRSGSLEAPPFCRSPVPSGQAVRPVVPSGQAVLATMGLAQARPNYKNAYTVYSIQVLYRL